MTDDRTRAFCCQAATPIVKRQTPADFFRRHERCIEHGDAHANEADEGLCLNELGGVKAEAVKIEVAFDAGDGLV